MRISTDPHLALQRKSHTTKASRAALADAIHGNALHSVTAGKPKASVCVGDLFDTYSNSEADILKAAKVAKHYDVVLAGNHDSLNVAESVSSLDLLAEMLPETSFLINPDFASHHVEYGELEGMALAFVPHHGSQELFDAALESMDYKAGESTYRAVFLHCNYDNGHTQGLDTSLNLTRVQADKLLTICDYIFLGHEHQPRQLLDGRLIICGCTHPTSFSDISDKYYYDLTPTSLDKTLIWSMATCYQEIDFNAEDLLPELNAATSIVDIKGEITADKGVQLAEAIKHYWQHPDALMIRNNVRIVSEDHQVIETVDFDKLPEVIAEQLKGGDLEETYEYYRGLVQC
jgi:DNA repair exonuclease SbcCD nuclease subunit